MPDTEIRYIKGVGERRAQMLSKLGIHTVGDLLGYYPRGYEDRSQMKPICALTGGDTVCFQGQLYAPLRHSVTANRRMTLQSAVITDGTGKILLRWFNQPWLKEQLVPGKVYLFFGTVTEGRGGWEVVNPLADDADNPRFTGRIMPIYPLTAGLTQKTLQTLIASCLEMAEDSIEETLSDTLLERYDLCSRREAVRHIHLPDSAEHFRRARRRLVFEELLFLRLGMRLMKGRKSGLEAKPLDNREGLDSLIASLPYSLTGAQQRTLDEILQDMAGSEPMNRLVQGDVGSGKTVVAALALYVCVRSGMQGALMAPTEILAAQHYETLDRMLTPLGIHVALLTGGLTAKNKRLMQEQIASGEAQIVIGTHALLSDAVSFPRLGLVVTDEQHRFGVRQRALLARRGGAPHLLVMTATPIPRTLALILYGDLEISAIDELPAGRQPIKTYCVGSALRERMYGFLEKKMAEGRQIYVVCPLVEESETEDLKSAEALANSLVGRFPGRTVGLLHGKMKPKAKDEVMSRFAAGEIDLLVSTTVIEVGVNVPNAAVMVVENAERFGLAQLHQLRGRVGRGGYESFCILVSDGGTAITRERLKIMCETNDGFVISEKDLELRGPGDFFGTMQHGLPPLRIANLYEDRDVLRETGRCTEEILDSDPYLAKEENLPLRREVEHMFSRVGSFELN